MEEHICHKFFLSLFENQEKRLSDIKITLQPTCVVCQNGEMCACSLPYSLGRLFDSFQASTYDWKIAGYGGVSALYPTQQPP